MKSDVVYTSVRSRRFDEDNIPLIINLSPRKICSMDCTYCYGGPTHIKTLRIDEKITFPLEYVKDEILKMFKWHSKNKTPITYIAFSGLTEPTMYPFFNDVVDYFFELKEKYFLNVPTAIYSNGTTLDKRRIKEGIKRFDRSIIKLDAGDEETFQRINRPVLNISLEKIVKNLIGIENIEITTIIIDNAYGNYESVMSNSYIEKINMIKPRLIWVGDADCTIPTDGMFYKLIRVPYKRLIELADFISQNTGIEVNVFKQATSPGVHPHYRYLSEKWKNQSLSSSKALMNSLPPISGMHMT